jgi:hypothetical protein
MSGQILMVNINLSMLRKPNQSSARFVKSRSLLIGLVFICALGCVSQAGQIGYLDIGEEHKDQESTFETACGFYGLEIERMPIVIFKNGDKITDVISKKKFRAIAIDASSFHSLERPMRLSTIKVLRMEQIPLLIFGIGDTTSADFLLDCSQGYISKCKSISRFPNEGYFKIEKIGNLTRQLSGIEFPYVSNAISYLCCDQEKTKPIVQLSDARIPGQFPVFVQIEVQGQETFFLAANKLNRTVGLPKKRRTFLSKHSSISQDDHSILRLLPFLIFLRYACDEMCWHSSKHFANLTIDDPWLTEPYGYLNFRELLGQMKAHNFHTTIGFIPWNYDRSTQQVVDLFKNNPDRYSICIHGNNHDHREFINYAPKMSESSKAKLLTHQEEDIKQALARMERFRATTGIPYDKVMIFPHDIAAEYALRLLNKYNFLATVNASNIPLDANKPSGILFYFRSLAMNYNEFASLRRDTPNKSISDIALDLFLDNPALFYVHHDYFRAGAAAFNNIADKVNRIQPDIHWLSLGNIIQEYYLEKQIDEENYEVMAFSNRIVIANQNLGYRKYRIHKEDSAAYLTKRITVDGRPYPYQTGGDGIELHISVPGGQSRHISIEYENELDLSSIVISKDDAQINRLRRISDFRDMKLSKNWAGRIITKFYYGTGLYKVGAKKLLIIFMILMTISCFIAILIIRKRRR